MEVEVFNIDAMTMVCYRPDQKVSAVTADERGEGYECQLSQDEADGVVQSWLLDVAPNHPDHWFLLDHDRIKFLTLQVDSAWWPWEGTLHDGGVIQIPDEYLRAAGFQD